MATTVYQSNIIIFHKSLDLLISSILNNNNNNIGGRISGYSTGLFLVLMTENSPCRRKNKLVKGTKAWKETEVIPHYLPLERDCNYDYSRSVPEMMISYAKIGENN